MKKICSLFILTTIFISAFSLSANAEYYTTKTDKFFAKVEETQALKFVPPDLNDTLGFEYFDTFVRVCTNDNGEEYVEVAGKTKVSFLEVEMFALKESLYMYFPQFDRHIDYSIVYKDKTDEVLDDLKGDADKVLMFPAHREHMYFYESDEETVEGYGTVYIEKFRYDKKAVLEKVVSSGELTLPEDVDIEKMSCNEIAWKLIDTDGEKENAFALFLFSDEAIFVFNEEGNLIGCNYYTGEGADLDLEMFDTDDYEYIAPQTDMSVFELPESSNSLKLLMFFIRFIFSTFVN